MRVVFQRVSSAFVEVNHQIVGEIEQGAVVFLGVAVGDTTAQVEKLACKVAELRVFTDDNDKMNRSVRDVEGGILLIPNFTLCGDCRHGRRPEFTSAARPETAKPLFEAFAEALRNRGVQRVETGIFGADMRVMAENDGPVTLVMDTADWERVRG